MGKEKPKTKAVSISSDSSQDSETDSENEIHMQNYKSTGDKTTSYHSEFYFNDSNFKTKMMSFPGKLMNEIDNQFSKEIGLDVKRVDIDKKNYDKSLEEQESFKILTKHVECVLNELNEKGKEKMFFLMDDVDLTSHSVSCLLYTSPSPRDLSTSRMPSSA